MMMYVFLFPYSLLFVLQGKPFWTRFIITFRSYTVKQGVIKQMSFDSPKLNDLLDQGFINMHEQFLEGEKQLSD
jgi:hypothetical protein